MSFSVCHLAANYASPYSKNTHLLTNKMFVTVVTKVWRPMNRLNVSTNPTELITRPAYGLQSTGLSNLFQLTFSWFINFFLQLFSVIINYLNFYYLFKMALNKLKLLQRPTLHCLGVLGLFRVREIWILEVSFYKDKLSSN